MDYLLAALCALQTNRRGITTLEYAAVAGLVVTVLGAALTLFFGDLQTALDDIGAAIPS